MLEWTRAVARWMRTVAAQRGRPRAVRATFRPATDPAVRLFTA
jgi:hypothetical protein